MTKRIPVIVVDRSSWSAASLFNPNDWAGDSKGIVQSCRTEFGVLIHCRNQIVQACRDSHQLCETHIKEIQKQWQMAKFDLSRVQIFGEVPDLHIRIEAFLSSTKTLLDLLVQLLASEGIVAARVHGFHEDGARVLKTLSNNPVKSRSDNAKLLAELINSKKALWIDKAIKARDLLIHPQEGYTQLMFQLDFSEGPEGITCASIKPPMIYSIPVDQYANEVISSMEDFITEFLRLVRGRKTPGS